jgi:flavin reductase (NADH)
VTRSNPATPAGATVDQYREFMSAFPTGVAVVTALSGGGQPCGMTCSSLSSVTLSPPTLLVCLRLGSRTESAVRATGAFAVNLLRAQAWGTAELFCAPIADRFSRVRWKRSPSGLPWLAADACASAECVVAGSLDVSDHAVLLGRVNHIVQAAADLPLLYGLRRFRAWNRQDPTARALATLRQRLQEEA